MMSRSTLSINSSSSESKETVKEPVSELDSEMADKMNIKCKNILIEYERIQNLDVCISYKNIYHIIKFL